MKKRVLPFIVIFIWGCTQVENQNQTQEKPKASDSIVSQQTTKEYLENNESVFELTNDSLHQVLQVSWEHEDKIEFSILSANKRTGCTSSYRGKATNPYPDSDPEADEDEDGEAYPATQYIHEGENCWINVRIALLDQSKAKVQIADCKEVDKQDCSLESQGVLERKNKSH